MMMNEEPVRDKIQQTTQIIEETFDVNLRRFKGGSNKIKKDHRRRRSTKEDDVHDHYNQTCKLMMNDEKVHYRSVNGEKQLPLLQFQYPFDHLNYQSQHQIQHHANLYFHQPYNLQQHHQQQQQQQQLQQQMQLSPRSPLQITPPLSTSHPLSSFQTPNSPIPTSNSNPLMMCPQHHNMPIHMPMPMPMPMSMSIPYSMPMPMSMEYGPSVPPMPLSMPDPMHYQMPMPLPMFIRLPVPSSPPASENGDNLKQFGSSRGTDSTTVVNFIPLMFPPHLGPMLLGPSQPIMFTRMSGNPPFHSMVNVGQQSSPATHQQQLPQSANK